jgi:hypothetical protein
MFETSEENVTGVPTIAIDGVGPATMVRLAIGQLAAGATALDSLELGEDIPPPTAWIT